MRHSFRAPVRDALLRRPHPLSRLDVYILDYLRKRRLLQTAAVFQSEAKLAEGTLGAARGARGAARGARLVAAAADSARGCFFFGAAIDAPGGFLLEWWSVFWEVFIARANDKSAGDAGLQAAG